MRKESHDKKLSCLSGHFVDDIRILVRQVEFIVAFLSCLCLDAQLAFIYIVEEQDGTEQRRFSNALGTDEMHVAIELYLCVWHVGTIYEYDFIEVSHLSRLRLC